LERCRFIGLVKVEAVGHATLIIIAGPKGIATALHEVQIAVTVLHLIQVVVATIRDVIEALPGSSIVM
jgi:hypothetical protein